MENTTIEPATTPLFVEDLDGVLLRAAHAWEALQGAQIFITGGTGFFGQWLLETIVWAIYSGHLKARIVVLTRDPAAFEARSPHLTQHSFLRLVQGNIRAFSFEAVRDFLPAPTHIIHAATESDQSGGPLDPLDIIETAYSGTRRILDFASSCKGSVRRLLYTSSGAVYGTQPFDMDRLTEDARSSPDLANPNSAYGESKRMAELLCICGARSGGYESVIARGFAFIGPFLPLDRNFAAGNFLRDALAGGPIRVGGDGTPLRSYLYGADLAEWLWTLLVRGEAGRIYNVGAEDSCSVRELAEEYARIASDPPLSVEFAHSPIPGSPVSRYVPSISRIRSELGLAPTLTWQQACARTYRWHRMRAQSTR